MRTVAELLKRYLESILSHPIIIASLIAAFALAWLGLGVWGYRIFTEVDRLKERNEAAPPIFAAIFGPICFIAALIDLTLE